MTAAAQWFVAAKLSDFGAERKLVRVIDGVNVLLLRLGSDVVAIHNRCTHLDQPLDRGRVMAGQITCVFHGACFDARTGAALSGPAVNPLHLFPVLIEQDEIRVDMRKRPGPFQNAFTAASSM